MDKITQHLSPTHHTPAHPRTEEEGEAGCGRLPPRCRPPAPRRGAVQPRTLRRVPPPPAQSPEPARRSRGGAGGGTGTTQGGLMLEANIFGRWLLKMRMLNAEAQERGCGSWLLGRGQARFNGFHSGVRVSAAYPPPPVSKTNSYY